MNYPIGPLAEKVRQGLSLTPEEGLSLFSSPLEDLLALAHEAKVRREGERVYYNINLYLNPSNICLIKCPLCAFYREEGHPEAYRMTLEDAVGKVRQFARFGITEVHVVGGVHPGTDLSYYESLFKALKAEVDGLFITGLTAVEVDYLARLAKLSLQETLLRLKEAGMDAMPGGGAEILAARARRIICPDKISGERWLEVHREAHGVGLRTNATMLYGHVETLEERIDHMTRLRDLQGRTGGFQAFVPLPFLPGRTGFEDIPPVSEEEILRTTAVARLYLDNFPHIKAHWVMTGEGTAQRALRGGADDLSGTLGEEKIAHATDVETPLALEVQAITDLIRGAGGIPVERDTFYRIVERRR